jgi:nucleotide-binding universal stress UspA family protein
MHIVLCLDSSSFTDRLLSEMQSFVHSLKKTTITVIHVIDTSLFTSGTGYETQLNEDLRNDSTTLEQHCTEAFGDKVKYIEEYGNPRMAIVELLDTMNYDMLAFGSHSTSILGDKLLGGVAEHLFRNCKKPVLIIS